MVVTFYKLRNFKYTPRAIATVTMTNLIFFQVTRKCNGLFWATYASTLEEVVEAVCQALSTYLYGIPPRKFGTNHQYYRAVLILWPVL